MTLSLWENIEKISNNFKEWIIQNNSPILMIGLFVGGLLVFSLTWKALNKNDN